LSNREELISKMQQAEQASQPTPEQQQMQQQAAQAQMAFQQSQTDALSGQAQESQSRAQKISVETQLLPQELEIDKNKAITANLKVGDQDDKEFERRMKIAQTMLKEKEIDLRTPTQQPTQPQQPQQPPQPQQQQAPLQLQGVPTNGSN
jgi:signal recognition particle GTPase